MFENCIKNSFNYSGNVAKYKIMFSVYRDEINGINIEEYLKNLFYHFYHQSTTLIMSNLEIDEDFELALYEDDFGEDHYKFDLTIKSVNEKSLSEYQEVIDELEYEMDKVEFIARFDYCYGGLSNSYIMYDEFKTEKPKIEEPQIEVKNIAKRKIFLLKNSKFL
jgi:hypothetical protein